MSNDFRFTPDMVEKVLRRAEFEGLTHYNVAIKQQTIDDIAESLNIDIIADELLPHINELVDVRAGGVAINGRLIEVDRQECTITRGRATITFRTLDVKRVRQYADHALTIHLKE